MGFSVNGIKAFCKEIGVKSILQTKPQSLKGINFAELKLAPKLEGDVFSLSTKKCLEEPNFLRKILNIKSGKHESIHFDDLKKISKDGRHFDLSAYNEKGDVIGLVRLKDAPNNQLNRMFEGNDDNCSLYIDYFATSPEYKGIGTKMLRKIVQISNNSGYGGRVSLEACTGSIPHEFMAVCGYEKAKDISCAIKYKKMGFNSILPELDKKVNQSITNGESGLKSTECAFGKGYRDVLSGAMQLSDTTIKKLLG